MAKEVLYFSKKGLSTRDALINQANLWGNTFFTTALVKEGKLIFWDQHKSRLSKSLNYCWKNADNEELLSHVQMATANIIEEFSSIATAYLRITFYRELGGDIHFWIWALEKDVLRSDIKAKCECYHPEENFPSFLKRSDYQFQFLLRQKAIEEGFDDVVLLDSNSYILELPTSNIIFKRRDEFFTPVSENKILEGITLERIETMLTESGSTLNRGRIHYDELHSFDSCYATSSFNGIRHISSIDSVPYNIDDSIIKMMLNFYGEIW